MSARSLSRAAKRVPRGGAPLLFLIIAVVGGLHALAILSLEISRLVYTEREVARLEREITQLEGEASDLRSVIVRRGDPRYREQLARLQGFIYSDEARYVTVAEPSSEGTTGEPEASESTD